MPTFPLLHCCAASAWTTAAVSPTSVAEPNSMQPPLLPVPRMFTAATAKPASSRNAFSGLSGPLPWGDEGKSEAPP